MLPSTRLLLCVVMVIGSALYAVLVSQDPDVASAVMLGYVGLLLTIFVATEVWKKSHHE
jgi:pilus assembly protein TadC